jgi:hypothetical protein
MNKWPLLGLCNTWVKDRDPLPLETHIDDYPLCIGDLWVNKKTNNMFLLKTIRNKERIWEDAIPLLTKVSKETSK